MVSFDSQYLSEMWQRLLKIKSKAEALRDEGKRRVEEFLLEKRGKSYRRKKFLKGDWSKIS